MIGYVLIIDRRALPQSFCASRDEAMIYATTHGLAGDAEGTLAPGVEIVRVRMVLMEEPE